MMRSFVLNLARSPERLAEFRANWNAPFPCERFEAVDGAKVPLPKNWRHGPGGYGLNMTYLALFLELVRAGQSEPFAVFEDDALFSAKWWDLEQAPAGWYSINLGPEVGDPRYLPPSPVNPQLCRLHHGWRTHACVYNPARLTDLIALLGMFPFTVDQIWCHLMVEHGCQDFYATRRFLVGTRGGQSLITGNSFGPFMGRDEWLSPECAP